MIKCGKAHQLKDFIQRVGNFQLFFRNYYKNVCGDSDPNLCPYCIFTLPPECLNFQMLFYPFEEDLYSSAITVKAATVRGDNLKLSVRKTNVFLVSSSK